MTTTDALFIATPAETATAVATRVGRALRLDEALRIECDTLEFAFYQSITRIIVALICLITFGVATELLVRARLLTSLRWVLLRIR